MSPVACTVCRSVFFSCCLLVTGSCKPLVSAVLCTYYCSPCCYGSPRCWMSQRVAEEQSISNWHSARIKGGNVWVLLLLSLSGIFVYPILLARCCADLCDASEDELFTSEMQMSSLCRFCPDLYETHACLVPLLFRCPDVKNIQTNVSKAYLW